jgi:hypothetical protein
MHVEHPCLEPPVPKKKKKKGVIELGKKMNPKGKLTMC